MYPTTLPAVATARTRLERVFDPEAVRRMKREAGSDITAGGPGLAAHAPRAGLVDELQCFVVPVVVGGGNPSLPGGVRLGLELRQERRFGNGVAYLRYRCGGVAG